MRVHRLISGFGAPLRGARKFLPGAIVEENLMARTRAELPAGSRRSKPLWTI